MKLHFLKLWPSLQVRATSTKDVLKVVSLWKISRYTFDCIQKSEMTPTEPENLITASGVRGRAL